MIHMNQGSKIVVYARADGTNTTSFLAAHFALRNTKNCGDEKARMKPRARRQIIFGGPERSRTADLLLAKQAH